MTNYNMVVNQSIWDTIDFPTKSGVAKAAACEAVNGNQSAQVEGTIYDSMNNNELGDFSGFTGEFTSKEPLTGP